MTRADKLIRVLARALGVPLGALAVTLHDQHSATVFLYVPVGSLQPERVLDFLDALTRLYGTAWVVNTPRREHERPPGQPDLTTWAAWSVLFAPSPNG